MATAEVTEPPSCVQPEVAIVERDIDGVPLRDHKKIDLKSILGHAPEIEEDDENEAPPPQPEVEIELETAAHATAPQLETTASDIDDEDDNDEDGGVGDCVNCALQRQRRSSLRTTQHHDPPDSPTGERKAVRFADSLGIGLEAIRDVGDSEEPPEIPHSAMTALRLRRKRSLNSRLVLVPTYSHPPVVDDDAVQPGRDRNHVTLESSFVSNRELTISGVVRVTHTSTEKTVTVRYTTDSWATSRDVPANYVPNSNDGTTDRFVFIVHLPDGFGEDEGFLPDRQGRLEFAVALHVGGDTFWDDNDGGKYVIDCVMRSRESSISGEAKTPDEVECLTLDGVGQ